ncbi:RND family efflux transporter, MFP subunit [Solimonas aquatica]|uniref:RND family efflux transporter, MFP subunit n=1 Tax=Solimonas aquatica TaxID=489703 RepID=A0A1H9MD14_9GAMM|nr:efflux RND transporter periplasmic adaptor subunit [Solimonas aquatica]SER21586.1 RND family efflux transporter, MFP subunit [Solimonas aquatica]
MRTQALIFAATVLLSACGAQEATPPSQAKVAAPLQLQKIEAAAVTRERAFDGVLEAVNQSTVAAQTGGRVVEMAVDVNDTVQKGQVLLRLRDTEPRAQRSAAQAAYAEAQAQYERVKTVYEQQLVAKAQMERATAARDRARAALDAASEQESNAVIRAPYAGIVTARRIEVGELAVPGRPVVELLSLDKLRVVVDLPQQFVSGVRSHPKARVQLPDGAVLPAAAVQLFPYADEHSHSFRARVELPDAGAHGVYPGQLVKVLFGYEAAPGLAVPAGALVRRGELTALYVARPKGGVELRAVRSGATLADGRIEILSGLVAGERIALDPLAAARSLSPQVRS